MVFGPKHEQSAKDTDALLFWGYPIDILDTWHGRFIWTRDTLNEIIAMQIGGDGEYLCRQDDHSPFRWVKTIPQAPSQIDPLRKIAISAEKTCS